MKSGDDGGNATVKPSPLRTLSDATHESTEPKGTAETARTPRQPRNQPPSPPQLDGHDGGSGGGHGGAAVSSYPAAPTTHAAPTVDRWASVLKILVADNVAGGLIGKKGQKINEIKRRTGATVKLSQANDFFPGTEDRVVLVAGKSAGPVELAAALVLERIRVDKLERAAAAAAAAGTEAVAAVTAEVAAEAVEAAAVEAAAAAAAVARAAAVHLSVAVVVPAAAVGCIIGYRGCNIEKIKEETGATEVHVSTFLAPHQVLVPHERVVHIGGPHRACAGVVTALIRNLAGLNPNVARYHNLTTSYSRTLAATHHKMHGYPHQHSPPLTRHHPGGYGGGGYGGGYSGGGWGIQSPAVPAGYVVYAPPPGGGGGGGVGSGSGVPEDSTLSDSESGTVTEGGDTTPSVAPSVAPTLRTYPPPQLLAVAPEDLVLPAAVAAVAPSVPPPPSVLYFAVPPPPPPPPVVLSLGFGPSPYFRHSAAPPPSGGVPGSSSGAAVDETSTLSDSTTSDNAGADTGENAGAEDETGLSSMSFKAAPGAPGATRSPAVAQSPMRRRGLPGGISPRAPCWSPQRPRPPPLPRLSSTSVATDDDEEGEKEEKEEGEKEDEKEEEEEEEGGERGKEELEGEADEDDDNSDEEGGAEGLRTSVRGDLQAWGSGKAKEEEEEEGAKEGYRGKAARAGCGHGGSLGGGGTNNGKGGAHPTRRKIKGEGGGASDGKASTKKEEEKEEEECPLSPLTSSPPPPPPPAATDGGDTCGGGNWYGDDLSTRSICMESVAPTMLAVPDYLVPVLMGLGGQILRNLQEYSGCSIKVSQRHELIPGTQNRIVTCTGTPEAMSAAQYLIKHRIRCAIEDGSAPLPPPETGGGGWGGGEGYYHHYRRNGGGGGVSGHHGGRRDGESC